MFDSLVLPQSIDRLTELANSANEKQRAIALGTYSIFLAVIVKASKIELLKLAVRQISEYLQPRDARWVIVNCQKHLDQKSQDWLNTHLVKIMRGLEDED